jgi:hypothetical protein
MLKSNKYSPNIKRRSNLFFATILVFIIAFSNFSDYALISDNETEKIENFADGENESKEQEKLEKAEKDVLLSKASTLKLVANINRLYNNQDLIKLYNLYLKISTPPPDLA